MLVPAVNQSPVRIPLGLMMVGFIPGYLLSIVLFPEKIQIDQDYDTIETDRISMLLFPENFDISDPARGIDGPERLVISIGFSLTITMVTVLLLHLSGVGVYLLPALLVLNGFVLTAVILVAYRRASSPSARVYTPDSTQAIIDSCKGLISFEGVDRLLLVVLIVMTLIVSVGTGFTILNPGPDDQYTEFYLLTENQSGNLIASDYPTALTPNQSKPVIIGITNHEFEPTRYTVVIKLQRTEKRAPSSSVIEERVLETFQLELDHDRTWLRRHDIDSTMSGENVRLMYLLYRGDQPSTPTRANSYRETYLWVGDRKSPGS